MKKKKPAKKKAAPKKAAKKAVKKKAPAKKKAAPKKAAAKKAPKAKAARPTPPPLPWRVPEAGERKIGVVDDYFGHIGVIAFTLEKPLAVGDRIHVHGHTTNLVMTVESIQVDHQPVQSAAVGAAVGIKVPEKCRKGDWIFQAPA